MKDLFLCIEILVIGYLVNMFTYFPMLDIGIFYTRKLFRRTIKIIKFCLDI